MPGHPIPEPYCWSDEFKVFYETLDAEHKGLFEGIFACNQARGDAGALAKLQKAVNDHFATEEAMMSKAGYAEFADHKKLHDNFVSTLGGVTAPIGDDTIKFAMQWLVDHIKDTDFQYKGKLD